MKKPWMTLKMKIGGNVTSHTISPICDILIKKILMWWRACSSCGKHGGRRAVARCPVLMIGKLTFCLDFPRQFEITSDQQTKLATFPNKSFSCTQWCKLREVIFLPLLFHIFTLSGDAQKCVLFWNIDWVVPFRAWYEFRVFSFVNRSLQHHVTDYASLQFSLQAQNESCREEVDKGSPAPPPQCRDRSPS